MKYNERKTGVILSYVGQIIQILSTIIYTPVMLRLLGQSEYGLYQMVYSAVSCLSLLSLGFGSCYIRYYSKLKVEKNDEGIARLNGTFMAIFSLMSVICFFCGSIMVKNIHMIFGKGLTEEEYAIAEILMVLMIFNLVLTFPNSVFNSFIIAHEKFVFQKFIIVLQNILHPCLIIPMLILGFGSIGMVCITTVLMVISFCVNGYFCIRYLKVRFSFKKMQGLLLREMWTFSFFIFLNQMIDQINWNIDKFLLGRFVGTSGVAIYGIGSQINTMYLQFSTSVSNVFIPKVNRMVAESDDNERLTLLFSRVGRIQFIIMSLILSGFVIFGKTFIRFWAGEEYTESYVVALLLITPVTVPLIQNLGIEIQQAKNKHRARSVIYTCIAGINFFASIPLIHVWGATGAAFGTAFSLIIGNVLFMNWYYHVQIGIDIIYFWKNIFTFIPAFIIPCTVGYIIARFVSFDNILSLCAGGFIYVVLFFCSMWIFGMNPDEKGMLVSAFTWNLKSKKRS